MTPKERATLRALRKEAKRVGATVTIDRSFNSVDLRVTAKDGWWFEAEEIHEFVDGCYKGWEPDYQGALDRLKHSNHEPHNDPDCEWCHDEEIA